MDVQRDVACVYADLYEANPRCAHLQCINLALVNAIYELLGTLKEISNGL